MAVKESLEGWLGDICVDRKDAKAKVMHSKIFCGFLPTNTNLVPSLVWKLMSEALASAPTQQLDAATLRDRAVDALLAIMMPEGCLLTSNSKANTRAIHELQLKYLNNHAHDCLRDLLRVALHVRNDKVTVATPQRLLLLTHARPPTTDQLVEEIRAVADTHTTCTCSTCSTTRARSCSTRTCTSSVRART